MARPRNTPADVWRRTAVGAANECWPFTGSPTTGGYGTFYLNGRHRQAHVVAYEVAVGPVPENLQLDHKCRNRSCCNPSHLEPVTGLENIRRSPIHNGARTHCPQGHPYSGDNLRLYRGGRYCRECIHVDSRERKRRNRTANRERGLTSRGTPPIYRPQSAKDQGPGCPGPRK